MSADLRFASVGRRFGRHWALHALELVCPAGTLTCLVGPNGAGKSTALALAAGLLAPTVGAIWFEAAPVRLAVPPPSTGYLPQRSAFHRSLQVGELLEFTRVARGASDDELHLALEVTGVGAVNARPVAELSGGWTRRLGLLSALLGQPRLLLLDEPLVGLDPETHDRLLDHLRERLDAGATIVMASHDFEALDPLMPRVAVLDEGRLCLVAAVGDTAPSSRSVYRQALAAGPPDAHGGAL